MIPKFWTDIDTVAPAELVDATLELHWAAQILAAAGQTFVAPRPDDSHRAMTWGPEVQGFVTEEFSEGYPFRLGLRVADPTLRLLDRTGATLGELALAGVTLEDGYLWLRTGLSQYMGGTGPEIERPEFALPGHPVGDGARFALDRGPERATLAALYGGAAEILGDVAAHDDRASSVRCWPHHFDIASLLTVRAADNGASARTIGIGLAPMGGGYPTWYWYVTPRPHPAASALPELKAPATWHTRDWTGAVLKGTDVLAAPRQRRRALVASFLNDAVLAATSALGV